MTRLRLLNDGFTLVEILVVIAVIGIVGSVMVFLPGAGKQSARDDRRIADLRQVEQSLRLFFLKCGFYPGSYDAANASCEGGLQNGQEAAENPDNWIELRQILAAAEIGVKKTPNDPLDGKNYEYRAELGGANSARGQCYWIMAALENPNHRALSDPQELDGTIDMSAVPALYPPTPLNCGGSAYCLSNIECTYDG